MGLLEGKRALIFGVANDHSIAWGIAKAMHDQGAQLAFSYAGEALERRVRPLAESVGSTFVEPCDVTQDEQIEALFSKVGERFAPLDILVHAIAYAERSDLQGDFHQTSRAGFQIAMNVSVYSFIALARAALPHMNAGGALLTLTYYGGQSDYPLPGCRPRSAWPAGKRHFRRTRSDALGRRRDRLQAFVSPIRRPDALGEEYHH